MTSVRRPAVAGSFYPENPEELRSVIDEYLAAVPADGAIPKAIIAPHAGYIYSGPVAASAYARLRNAKGVIRRVILLGPSHRVPLHGLAACSAQAFATPLGAVPVDAAALAMVAGLPQMRILDAAHVHEHSLEVHLPFLQRLLGNFKIVPLVAGDASAEEVGEVLEKLWGGTETLIVVSSDLSHYLAYDAAQKIDRVTSAAIEALRPQDIGYEQACGRIPITGLLHAARKHGLRAETVDLRNSGDTAGARDRVVGYGAYIFCAL